MKDKSRSHLIRLPEEGGRGRRKEKEGRGAVWKQKGEACCLQPSEGELKAPTQARIPLRSCKDRPKNMPEARRARMASQ